MRTKIFAELKDSFYPYTLFWDDWKHYKFNGLTSTDIYMIDVHKKNNFSVTINDFIMFYNQLEPLYDLTYKLKKNLVEFQDWLIMKFQFALIRFSQGINLDLYFLIPIKHLQLPEDLQTTLLKFRCKNLSELFSKYSDADLRNTNEFLIITEFLAKQININQLLKKEVTTINCN